MCFVLGKKSPFYQGKMSPNKAFFIRLLSPRPFTLSAKSKNSRCLGKASLFYSYVSKLVFSASGEVSAVGVNHELQFNILLGWSVCKVSNISMSFLSVTEPSFRFPAFLLFEVRMIKSYYHLNEGGRSRLPPPSFRLKITIGLFAPSQGRIWSLACAIK